MNKIGVVIPVYNGAKTIEKSIKSLLYQKYRDWVAIIINDGSTDDTKKILDNYNNDDRFCIYHFHKNKGRPYARQMGLDIIKDKNLIYMCMLDADDWYYPNKLQFQYDFMENNSNITLLSSAIGVTSEKNNLFKVIKPFSDFTKLKFTNFKNYQKIPHASSIIRVNEIGKNVNYDLDLKLSQDQDFLRKLLINKKYAFDPRIQYIYNRNQSFSVKKYKMSMYYNYLSFKKLKMGRLQNSFCFFKNKIKLYFVRILSFFNLENIYKSKIGVSPTKIELSVFINNKKKLN